MEYFFFFFQNVNSSWFIQRLQVLTERKAANLWLCYSGKLHLHLRKFRTSLAMGQIGYFSGKFLIFLNQPQVIRRYRQVWGQALNQYISSNVFVWEFKPLEWSKVHFDHRVLQKGVCRDLLPSSSFSPPMRQLYWKSTTGK